jgi:hypothetical protein
MVIETGDGEIAAEVECGSMDLIQLLVLSAFLALSSPSGGAHQGFPVRLPHDHRVIVTDDSYLGITKPQRWVQGAASIYRFVRGLEGCPGFGSWFGRQLSCFFWVVG